MRVSVAILTRFCADILEKANIPAEDALTVARFLVRADREGVETHGVTRLTAYIANMRQGRINPRPTIVLEQTAPSLGRVDGDDCLGFLAAVQAMDFALSLAGQAGTGFVTVSRSGHYGTASTYALMAAERGMIGMAFTNAPASVTPWGGRKAFFGTNPFAMAFPGRNGRHVCVDLSTSITAKGRIILAAKTGAPIPGDWALDAEGRPTTDSRAAMAGAVLPMAGPKGYAMALAVDILCGVLSGAAFGKHVGSLYEERSTPFNTGHAFLAVDVARLMDLESFLDRLETLVTEIEAEPLAQGFDAIRIPGDRGRRLSAEREREVPLADNTLKELDGLAREMDLPTLSERLEK